MPTDNPFPLNIPAKVNSPELLAFFQQFGIDKYLSAEEINKLVQAAQFLYENIGGGSLSVSGITTLGTITIDGDEVTFSEFEWKIAGVDYAQAAPITRTLPFASEGMYRTHTAYFTTTNDINISVGAEDDEVTTEPNIPEGTLRMRAFNVFGEVITVGPGESLPFNMLTLDQLLVLHPNAQVWVNVDGLDLRFNLNELVFNHIQNIEQVLIEGNSVTDLGISFLSTGTGQLQIDASGIMMSDDAFENFIIINSNSIGVAGNLGTTRIQKDRLVREFGSGKRTEIEFEEVTGLEVGKYIFPKVGNNTERVASREWTENLLEGLKTKQPVRVATTANITLSGTQTIDGVALSVDDRVLVKDQSTQTNNGIYLVKSGSWERSTDANTATELTNAVVTVLEGTANGQATFRQTATSITLDTTNLIWQTFGASVPDATPSTKGKAKLYNDLGINEDGGVTQKVFKERLDLKLDRPIRWTTPDVTHTGDTNKVILKAIEFSGTDWSQDDFMAVFTDNKKVGTGGICTWRYEVNTSNSLVGSQRIANFAPTASTINMGMKRENFLFKPSDVLEGFNDAVSSVTDISSSAFARTSTSIAYTGTWWLLITGQMANAADTISCPAGYIQKI